MSTLLPLHTTDTAPEASRPSLAKVDSRFGFVPNLIAGLANAPAALQGYLGIAEQFAGSTLSTAEQHVVLLATSIENRCEYCVAAHSMMAGKDLSPAIIGALRAGSDSGDSRLDALARTTRAIVRKRGWLDTGDIAEFEAAGFSRTQLLDVLVGVAQKTLSNYANHIIGTPLDARFEATRWDSGPAAAA